MILGTVQGRDPIIRLFIQGAGSILHEIEAVVDTGFTEDLTLPQDLVNALGLPFRIMLQTALADGTAVECAVHSGTLLWDGVPRSVDIQVSETKPLAGMGLIMGCQLLVEGREGGTVSLTPLP